MDKRMFEAKARELEAKARELSERLAPKVQKFAVDAAGDLKTAADFVKEKADKAYAEQERKREEDKAHQDIVDDLMDDIRKEHRVSDDDVYRCICGVKASNRSSVWFQRHLTDEINLLTTDTISEDVTPQKTPVDKTPVDNAAGFEPVAEKRTEKRSPFGPDSFFAPESKPRQKVQSWLEDNFASKHKDTPDMPRFEEKLSKVSSEETETKPVDVTDKVSVQTNVLKALKSFQETRSLSQEKEAIKAFANSVTSKYSRKDMNEVTPDFDKTEPDSRVQEVLNVDKVLREQKDVSKEKKASKGSEEVSKKDKKAKKDKNK